VLPYIPLLPVKSCTAGSSEMLKIKRIYEKAEPADGLRVLVDRLWPRGVSKEKAALADWMKEVAPSDELRHWFGHEETRWDEFKSRYMQELGEQKQAVDELVSMARQNTLTLLYAAKNEQQNNAVVLKELIEQLLEKESLTTTNESDI